MSNHYQLVVILHPKAPHQWSDEEVVERWDRASFSQNMKKRQCGIHLFEIEGGMTVLTDDFENSHFGGKFRF